MDTNACSPSRCRASGDRRPAGVLERNRDAGFVYAAASSMTTAAWPTPSGTPPTPARPPRSHDADAAAVGARSPRPRPPRRPAGIAAGRRGSTGSTPGARPRSGDALAAAQGVDAVRTDGVPPGTAADPVAPPIAGVDRVVARAGEDHARARPAPQDVIASATVEAVTARPARQGVVAGGAGQPVVAGTPEQRVVAGAA